MIPRQALVILLAVFLAIPISATPELVGTVAGSQSASARGADLLPGTTIFSGDTVAVREHGTARITLAGGSLVRLAENSELNLQRTTKAVRIQLNKGQVNFRSIPQSPVEGMLGDATFRPAHDSAAAVGALSFTSANSALLVAEHGDWIITTAHDGKDVVLHEGTAMEARLEASAPDGYAQRPPTAAKGGGSALLVILIGIILIAGTIAAALILGSSESGVSCQEQINAVSPFTPCQP